MLKTIIKTYQTYGPLAAATDILDRILRRLGITKIERVFTVTSSAYSGAHQAEVLTVSQIKSYRGAGALSCSEQTIQDVEAGNKVCVAVVDGNNLCGFTWYTLRPYRHSDSDFAFFDPDYICGYGAYISPDYRGQGIRAAIVKRALDYARSLERKGIIAAITWTNFGSLRSAHRIGYNYHRLAWKAGDALSPHNSLYQLRTISNKHALCSAFIGAAVTDVTRSAYQHSALSLVIDTSSNIQPKSKIRQVMGRSISLGDWAKSKGIPYVRFERPNQKKTAQALTKHHIELLISYAAPILDDHVIKSASVAAINIHPSLLPDYRGGSPLLWQLISEEPTTGATVHLLTEKVDQGGILAQVESTLPKGLSRKAVFSLARKNAAEALTRWLVNYVDKASITPRLQPESSNTPYARNLTLAAANKLINWETDSPGRLYALTRYLDRWPYELVAPPTPWRWVPLKAIGVSSSCSSSGFSWHTQPHLLRFSNTRGSVLLRPSLNPLRWLSHWRNWRRLAQEQGKNIYL